MNHILIDPATSSACYRALRYGIDEVSTNLRRFEPGTREYELLAAEMHELQNASHAITSALPVPPGDPLSRPNQLRTIADIEEGNLPFEIRHRHSVTSEWRDSTNPHLNALVLFLDGWFVRIKAETSTE